MVNLKVGTLVAAGHVRSTDARATGSPKQYWTICFGKPVLDGVRMPRSRYLSSLGSEERQQLVCRLHRQQHGRCFICTTEIDLDLHKGEIDIDHIDPLLEDGRDDPSNFALTHAKCNRSKGASNLQVARRVAEFERLQEQARSNGKRGADLGDVLSLHNGAKANLRLVVEDDRVKYSLPNSGNEGIYSGQLMRDKLSSMDSFVAQFPLEFLHHDDRMNPRSIGSNIRNLIEEFLARRPQLHMALGWWEPDDEKDRTHGKLRLFDGQHKVAAQVLLGVTVIPVRVFVCPDTNVLLKANTNAGGKLRQVAFDSAVMRHLGNTLYEERVNQFRQMGKLSDNDLSFSEQDLVKFFRGESREMIRYIIDAQRDRITRSSENKLLDFVEWSGRSNQLPMAYTTIERSFFKEFLHQKALDTPLDEGYEQGINSRQLEREQLTRIMSLFSEVFLINKWDREIGGRRLETRVHAGERIPENHLRAWRVSREEVLAIIVRYLKLVITNYLAWTGGYEEEDRLLHKRLPDELWTRMQNFLINLAGLPCWIDTGLATTIFGAKQNRDYWASIFKSGKTPSGIEVLAQPLRIQEMILDRSRHDVSLDLQIHP